MDFYFYKVFNLILQSAKNYGPLIILVLLIDTIGRVITSPNEIAANIILAIVGGPVMILILWKRQKNA